MQLRREPTGPSPHLESGGERRGRRRPGVVVLASCLGLVAGSVLPAAPAATAADPLRIMPVGDSITHGSDGDATYRYFLWKDLQASGAAVDFVGTMNGVRDGAPRYADFDQDHDGHGGFRADELVDGRPDRRGEGELAGWVAAERPDVILLHIGTNDIRQCQSVDSTVADIGRTIDVARRAQPGVAVLVARIIPTVGSASRPCAPEVPQLIRQLNDGISALAAEKDTAGAPVRVVDQHAGFDVDAHTSDGVHPNEEGDRRLAARWAAALASLPLGGTPGSTSTTTTAPPATTTTTATPATTTTTTTATPATTTTTATPATTTTTTTPATTTTTTAPLPTTTVPLSTTTTVPPATTTTAPTTTTVPPLTTTTVPPVTAAPVPTTTTPPTTTTTSPPATPTAPAAPTTAADVPRTGYWMVSATGDVYAFGDAQWLGNAQVGARAAVGIDATADHDGYWVVDDGGTVHAFGSAPHLGDAGALEPGERVTALSGTPTGRGYWLSTDQGRVLPFGDAEHHGDLVGTPLNGPVLDADGTALGGGYHLVGADGGVFSFGDAAFHGSTGAEPPSGRVVSLAPDHDGAGYWLVGAGGGVFAFDAPFLGSMAGQPLNAPMVGMVPYGTGYLLVGADGGIFSFSDAPFAGSLGADPPPAPIVDVAALDERRR